MILSGKVLPAFSFPKPTRVSTNNLEETGQMSQNIILHCTWFKANKFAVKSEMS